MKPQNLPYRILREECYYGGYLAGNYEFRYSVQKRKFFGGYKEIAYYYDKDEALDHLNMLMPPKIINIQEKLIRT